MRSPLPRRAIVAVTSVATAAVILVTGAAYSAAAWSSSPELSPRIEDPVATPSVTPHDLIAVDNLPTAPVGLQDTIDNVVFILADDLDWATFRSVPRLSALVDQGTTFANFTVTDSLCCPSRSSILRSQYVHNHLVVSNREASGGGWPTFHQRGEEDDCLATWLSKAGVRTAFFGKYLNEFGQGGPGPTYVPPGWDRWFVPVTDGAMYAGYNYTVNSNGILVKYGSDPHDFLSDVLTDKATNFIRTTKQPFYVQLNVTNPHSPLPIAPRNRKKDSFVQIPRSANFNAVGLNEPVWRSKLPVMGPKRIKHIEKKWIDRVRSAESVADAYDAVRAALKKSGKLEHTLIVVGSDNGYHAATRRLPPGKRTPYFEDTVVPYVFIGPGVQSGRVVNDMTSTIDLGPTFSNVLGTTAPSWTDGRSLQPFLGDQDVNAWRTGVLSESMSDTKPGDPDYEAFKPPAFKALRTPEWLYVEYVDGTRELVHRTADPAEMNNVIDSTDPGTVAKLAAQLHALGECSGETCRVADEMPN